MTTRICLEMMTSLTIARKPRWVKCKGFLIQVLSYLCTCPSRETSWENILRVCCWNCPNIRPAAVINPCEHWNWFSQVHWSRTRSHLYNALLLDPFWNSNIISFWKWTSLHVKVCKNLWGSFSSENSQLLVLKEARLSFKQTTKKLQPLQSWLHLGCPSSWIVPNNYSVPWYEFGAGGGVTIFDYYCGNSQII